jgi:hypothetical protein
MAGAKPSALPRTPPRLWNRRAELLDRVPAPAVLAGLLLIAGVMLLYAGRHLTFFYDEWSFILQRRSGGLDTYLNPHNGHLVLFSAVVYKLLFALVGLRHYVAYQAVAVALHLMSCALLYVVARRRLGPWPALIPTTLLLFMGTAWQVLLWPFQIAYLASVAGGLVAVALLERRERRHDLWAAAALIWAVASSGVGLAFVVACGLLLLYRRDPLRRLWVVVLPLILFALWYLGWGTSEPITSDSVLRAPQYVATAAAGVSAGIAGLDVTWGPALVVAFVGVFAVAWRRRGGGEPTPLVVAALGGVLTFWVLAALTRADSPDPTASRYLYVGAAFILIALIDAAVGIRVRGTWALLCALVLVGALVANLGALRQGERSLRSSDTAVRASLAVVELAAPVVSPAFLADSTDAPQLTAGGYFAAVRDLGSPALTLQELQRAPEAIRLRSDSVLAHAERLVLTAGKGSASISCLRREPGRGSTVAELTAAPGSTIAVQAAPRAPGPLVSARRLADEYGAAPVGQLAPGVTAALELPRDRAPSLPWRIRVLGGRGFRVCVS